METILLAALLADENRLFDRFCFYGFHGSMFADEDAVSLFDRIAYTIRADMKNRLTSAVCGKMLQGTTPPLNGLVPLVEQTENPKSAIRAVPKGAQRGDP